MDKDFRENLPPALAKLNDVIPAIGLTAVCWTQVEITTQRIMASLLRAEGRISVALTAHIPDRTAIDLILAVTRQYDLPTETSDAIEAFAKAHNICRENRNLVVHGIHGKSEKGITPERSFIQKVSARGKVRIVYYEISVAEIYEISKECSALAGYGQEIIRNLDSQGPGANPHKLPRLFPQLNNRSNSLPQLDVHDVLLRRPFASGWTATHSSNQ